MTDTIRTEFAGFVTTVTSKGREGSIQVSTQIQGMPISDDELAELRKLQGKAAMEVDKMLNG